MTKRSVEIIEGLSVELTPEQLTEAARKLQSAADKARKEAQKPRFKVGDIVAVTGRDYSKNVPGDVGKIVCEVLDNFALDIPGKSLERNWSMLKNIRLATAEEIAKYEEAQKPKLKVGDWVRAKVSAQDITEGKAYKVESIHALGFPWIRDDAGDHNRLETGNFEIIAEPTPFDRAGRKPGEFKKGDIVRVTKCVGYHHENELGEIIEVDPTDRIFPAFVRAIYDGKSRDLWESHIELVTPVESRVDRAEGADVA